MQEIWKDVKGYEGYYQVSDNGNVKSLRNGKILVPAITIHGYKRITLCKNGKKENKVIHRLVAEVFLDNPKNYPCVNHKDENKLNNFVENLEWCDKKYNTNYGGCIKRRSEKHNKKVTKYDLNMNKIETYDSIKQASIKNEILNSCICVCCKKKYRTAGGFYWRYENE